MAFWPAFLALAALGLFGVAVFALTAPKALLEKIPVEGGPPKRLLIAVQPAILTVILAAAGTAVATSAASTSLIALAAGGGPLPDNWAAPLVSFAFAGMALGALLYLLDRWWKPWWAGPGDNDLIADWRPSSLLPGVSYGGITEEILMRWGIMGILIWALVSIFGGADGPGPAVVAAGIVLSSLVFAAGHLPAALIGKKRSSRFVFRIMILNTVAGLLFGWLFWRWNLETAMAAHAGFHIGAALLSAGVLRRPAKA